MEANENEFFTAQNLWYSAKAVLKGKYIAHQAYIKKQSVSNTQPKLTHKGVRK